MMYCVYELLGAMFEIIMSQNGKMEIGIKKSKF